MSELPAKANRHYGLTLLVIMLIAAAVAAANYMTATSGVEAQPAPTAAPPPPVTEVAVIKTQSVRSWSHFSGRLAAVNTAEIKPQVSGEIQKVLFEDGQLVAEGAPLFLIDSRPYQAAVNKAQAQLTSANSQATLAKDELKRTRKLAKGKLVSDSVYDAAKNEYQVTVATIEEAKSALVQARLNLDYCHVRAPFSGRVGRAELTVGNIVAPAPNAPVLTRLVSNDKLYAEFNVDEQTYIKMVRNSHDIENMPVKLTLAADKSVVYKGHIHSFDNQLDSSSGTIRARAIFANVDGVLTPGMYANVSLGSAKPSASLLIPRKAIGTNQDQKFVYVVGEGNKVVYREVSLGNYHDRDRVVLSGLHAGERIVVNGLSHIRTGVVITPKLVEQPHTVADSSD